MKFPALGRPAVRAAWVAIALQFGFSGVVRADASAAQEADRLFRQGKEWLASKDYARACPLLAESFRVDPATGALLALAICHESQGKLATAFREYNEVAARSQVERRKDREQAARDKASALASQVSTLTISLAGDRADVEVQLDDVVIDRALLGKPLPVDGGSHVVKLTGVNRSPSLTRLMVAERRAAETVVIAALPDERLAATPSRARSKRMRAASAEYAPTRRTSVPARRPATASGLSGWQWTGIVMMGLGAVGLGAGTYLAIDAVVKNNDSMLGCVDDVCTIEGRRDRQYALQSGDRATIALAVGGPLAAIGLMTFLLGADSSPDEEAAFGASAWMADEAGGVTVRGRF